ncbi:UDP-glucose 4-epimerase family protein [Marinobacter lacisalsi]|uniref:UDP-glucose 4-epimerase family protein n=1 Tax=Marinobacter lacisalsi TaxID=475979 RepID=A0ABV8QL20_9GAMM
MVTGASGFLGRALVRALADQGTTVRAAIRASAMAPDPGPGVSYHQVEDIDGHTRWQESLAGAEVVMHCAARVHVMHDDAASPLAAFRAVNRDGTLNLARQAAEAGVRRFVFISSVKVNGEHTDNRGPFEADEAPAPEDAYGISKREAEDDLRDMAQKTGMEVVIIRPPLVYGPGVKGNFRSLLKLASLPVPLPFGAIDNRRSLVYLGNLVDFICVASEHPAAANQTFLVSDGDDLSTTRLLQLVRTALGRRPMLVPVPPALFRAVGALTGTRSLVQRLCGSLQVDITRARRLLGWQPPFTVKQGLADTVNEHFRADSR